MLIFVSVPKKINISHCKYEKKFKNVFFMGKLNDRDSAILKNKRIFPNGIWFVFNQWINKKKVSYLCTHIYLLYYKVILLCIDQ